MGVESAGIGQDPGVAAAEGIFLEADAGVFNAGNYPVRANAHERDNRGTPTFDFGFKPLASGAKFVLGEFIRTRSSALDHVGYPEFKIEKERSFKRGKEPRRKATAVERGPEAVTGPAEMAADSGRVQARIDASEKDDEVFGDKIRDELVMRGKDLSFGGLPGRGQCPFHMAAS